MSLYRTPVPWVFTDRRGGSAKPRITLPAVDTCAYELNHISASISGGVSRHLKLKQDDEVIMQWDVTETKPLVLNYSAYDIQIDKGSALILEMDGGTANGPEFGTINMIGHTEHG